MRRSVILLWLICPFVAAAQEAAGPGEDFFPLAVGNTWTYRVLGQDDRFVVRVMRKEMIGEQTTFQLEGRVKDKVVATEHLAFTKEGLTRFRADKEDVVPPVNVLQLPIARSREWKADFQVGERKSSVKFKRDFFSPNVIADVPYGRFRAIKIDAEITPESGGKTLTYIWYAERVGVVKQTIMEGKRPLIVLELEKFEKGE